MIGAKLMFKRFQGLSQVCFPLIDLDLGYRYIIWKVTPQIGDKTWKTPSAYYASGVGDFMLIWGFQACLLSKMLWWSVLWCLDYRVLLYLCCHGPGSRRSELRRHIQNRNVLGSNPCSRWPWCQHSH